MSEAVTVPRLMMTSIISEESLARDGQTDRPTHAHTHARTHTHSHTYTHTHVLISMERPQYDK